MPEFIPFTERPEFIPRAPKGTPTSFERAAALFAYGEVDAVLRAAVEHAALVRHLAAPSLTPHQHMPSAEGALEKAVVNG